MSRNMSIDGENYAEFNGVPHVTQHSIVFDISTFISRNLLKKTAKIAKKHKCKQYHQSLGVSEWHASVIQ